MENIKLTNYNLNKDIENAKSVIDKTIDNNSFVFNECFPIYKSTNECISHIPYMDSLKNKDRILSVIGSGDQIINAILFGTNDIVGVDISTFPKYFLPLKLAAIKVLEKNTYLEYFYGIKEMPFQDKYYEIIRKELDEDIRIFWDFLYNYNNNLYDTHLFYDFNIGVKTAVLNNPFLQDNYFNVLKRNIEKVKLELLKYDMFDANKLNKGYFDLIMLSNIINNASTFNGERLSISEYNERFLQLMKKYKKFLKSLPLTKNGVALTYNFSFNGNITDFFKEKEYKVYRVKENTNSFNCENEILIYKRGVR